MKRPYKPLSCGLAIELAPVEGVPPSSGSKFFTFHYYLFTYARLLVLAEVEHELTDVGGTTLLPLTSQPPSVPSPLLVG